MPKIFNLNLERVESCGTNSRRLNHGLDSVAYEFAEKHIESYVTKHCNVRSL